ncbi:MAG: hypothetical protein LLG06_06430 [Desulfobacteraceae bacterium]|nr:hypothetical protein [Desulfobacteraceae bacterium]
MNDTTASCLKDLDFEKVPVGRLEPGKLGVLLARAGAGKTACLTQIAIGYMLRGESVLHVCVDIVPDKVKVWYHELLKDIFSSKPGCNVTELQHQVEPLRFIMSFLNQTFSPDKLQQSIENLKAQAKFSPSLLILDGLDFDRNERPVFEKIGDLARELDIPIWMSARMHRHISDVNERGIPYPIDKMDDLFASVASLAPESGGIRLRMLKQNENINSSGTGWLLDPNTFLLLKDASK